MTSWQRALQQAITEPKQLLTLLQLDEDDMAYWPGAPFKCKVPRSYVDRMEKGNPRDPLLLECIPQRQEQNKVEGYLKDPLSESDYSPAPGLLHKYKSRVLLTVTGTCPIHCRYCFRRHFPYQEHVSYDRHHQAQKDYLIANPEIKEVIFSGGDPWVLSDHQLKGWIEMVSSVPHVSLIRFHTRMPVLLPERVTSELLEVLASTRLKVVVVAHANHASALDVQTASAFSDLASIGVTLLNQSVLLKDINDSAEALMDLSYTLFDQGVLPYYIHQLDPVEGAAHFQCSDAIALSIMAKVRATLPGYLVPRLVVEKPGKTSKVPLSETMFVKH